MQWPQQSNIYQYYKYSHAAIKAFNIRSAVVSSRRKDLFDIPGHYINLCWVPGHGGILCNGKVDELAKRGAQPLIEKAEMEIHAPTVIDKIKEKLRIVWLNRWQNFKRT